MAYPFVSYSVHRAKESHTCRTQFFSVIFAGPGWFVKKQKFCYLDVFVWAVGHVIVLSLASVNVRRTSNNTVFFFLNLVEECLATSFPLGKLFSAPISEKKSYSVLCYYNLWFTSERILGQELVSISKIKMQVEGLVWLRWFSKRLASLIYLPYRTIQELLSIFEIMIFVLFFALRRWVTTWSITSLLAKHL